MYSRQVFVKETLELGPQVLHRDHEVWAMDELPQFGDEIAAIYGAKQKA